MDRPTGKTTSWTSIVDGITNAQVRSTTLKLVPRASSSNLNTTGEPS